MYKLINFLLQIFFIRIIKNEEKIIDSYRLMSFDIMADGNVGSRGYGTFKTNTRYSIQGFIVPFTNFKLNKQFNLKITNKYCKNKL